MNKILNQNDFANKFDDYFTYIETLGQGAFGIVVKALDNQTKQLVAVKVIQKQIIKKFEELELEANILSQLTHQNIVKFYDLKRTDTRILIVMELINGHSLQRLIKDINEKDACISEYHCRYILLNLMKALSYIHEQNIVHRDLKPDNILIGDGISCVKITDFGLSSHHSKFALIKKPCGTISYMAPELFSKKIYSKNVDIWSAGIILYQLLNHGKHPYYKRGINQEDMIQSMENMHTVLDFKGMNQNEISLFKRMTEIDYTIRYSADQVLMHPWISEKNILIPQNFTEMWENWMVTQKFINISKCILLVQFLKINKSISRKKYIEIKNGQTKQNLINEIAPNFTNTGNLVQLIKIKQRQKQNDSNSSNASPIISQNKKMKTIQTDSHFHNYSQLSQENQFSKLSVPYQTHNSKFIESPEKINQRKFQRGCSLNTHEYKFQANSNSPLKRNQKFRQQKIQLNPISYQKEFQQETQTVEFYSRELNDGFKDTQNNSIIEQKNRQRRVKSTYEKRRECDSKYFRMLIS